MRSFALIFCFSAFSTIAGTLVFPSQWRWRNPVPPETLRAIASDGTNLLAVGTGGTRIHVVGLTNATIRNDGVTESGVVPIQRSFTAVAFGNGTWVAVGEKGLIMQGDRVRTNGLSRDFYGLRFGNGQFIAWNPYPGEISLSATGENWEVHPTPAAFFDILATNGIFLAATRDHTYYISTNAREWTLQKFPRGRESDRVDVGTIAFRDGIYCGTGNRGTFVTRTPWSTNGSELNSTWVEAPSIGLVHVMADEEAFWGIRHHNDIFKSLDGLDWQYAQDGFFTGKIIRHSGKFVGLGLYTDIFFCADGTNWTSLGTGRNQLGDEVSGARLNLFADEFQNLYWTDGRQIFVTTNTITWTKAGEAPAPADIRFRDIARGNGRFVGVRWGYGVGPSVSMDGFQWTQGKPETTNNTWRAIEFGNGVFVGALGEYEGTDLKVSSNGEEWTTVKTGLDPGMFHFGSLTFSDGLFIACAWYQSVFEWPPLAYVLKSTNGIDWSISPKVERFFHVDYLMNLRGRLLGSDGFFNDDLSRAGGVSLPLSYYRQLIYWKNTLVVGTGIQLLQSDPLLEVDVLGGARQRIEIRGLLPGTTYELMWSQSLDVPPTSFQQFSASSEIKSLDLPAARSGFFWIRTLGGSL